MEARESRPLCLTLLLLSGVVLCPFARARTLRVDEDGPADYRTIQAAIDATVDGDVVLVAPGTYTGDGNRDIDFKGKAIALESEQGAETCIIDSQGSMDNPHRGFHLHSGEDANCIVQGFTITGGFVTGNDSATAAGGGILCDASSPRIADCIILRNTAESGAGIACIDSNSIIANCVISGNNASASWDWGSRPESWEGKGDGGGLRVAGAHPMLINCLVTGNRASNWGGGVCCGGNFIFRNCTISGNRSGHWGGGIILRGWIRNTTGVLHNCIIWDNTASRCAQIGHVPVSLIGIGTGLRLSHCTVQDPDLQACVYGVQGTWTSIEPLFVNSGYWDPNETPNDPDDDFWVDGDYHLKSQAGRWDSVGGSWIADDVTSPCIDAGDPNSPVGLEPFPNGGRINMGAYGGTAEASKSPSGVHAKYGGGAGEPENPYLIYTAQQMSRLAAELDDWGKSFRLMADIDLSEYAGGPLDVIGTGAESPFAGVFDGDGHAISGFVCSDGVGLFGYVSGTVKNVGLIGPNIDEKIAYHVGSLIGDNYGTVANCYAVDANVAAGSRQAGGLVGYNKGTVTNCHSSGTVSGGSAGGLVGANRGTLGDCWSDAAVAGDDKVGGLAGDNANGTILNCRSTGNVLGDDVTGGLVGDNSHGMIAGCCSTGTVVGNDGVGGLVGQNWFGTIVNSYSTASATGDRMTGGLVGDNGGAVTNCCAAGPVSGNRWPIAGLISFRHDDDTVTGSFWDTETTTCSWSAGGTGKTTAEMQTASTFLAAGWDFVGETKNGTEDIWRIVEGQDYPRLQWEPQE